MTGFFWPIKSVNTNIKAATLVAATAFLVSCGTPERLPQDVSIDQSKRVVEDRILAPLSRDNVSTALLPEKKPRRQLLQVRYHEESLTSANFISDLRRLSSTYAGTLPSDNELKVLTGYNEEPVDEPVIDVTPEPVAVAEEEEDFDITLPEPYFAPISAEEYDRITTIRAEKRARIIIRQGLTLEQELFASLAQLEDQFTTAGQALETTLFTELQAVEAEIVSLEANQIPGVATDPPGTIFGRDLTRDSEGYFALPPDLALIGSASEGAVSSKIANLRVAIDNPVLRVSFGNLRLAEAIRFICRQANLPVLLSNDVEESEQLVSLNVEAGVLSILDALFSQYDISIIYDDDLEVAQVYTDGEFEERLGRVRAAVETFNTSLFNERQLDDQLEKRDIILAMIELTRAMVYAYRTDQAAFYDQDTADKLVTRIRSSTDTFSKPLAEKRILEQLIRDKERLMEMIAIVQTMLSGDADIFVEDIETLTREPGNIIITETLNKLTLKALEIGDLIKAYDAETQKALADRLVVPEIPADVLAKIEERKQRMQKKAAAPVITKVALPVETPKTIDRIPGFENLAVLDPCVYPGREVFTEKIAVYGGESAINRVQGILDGYFNANASTFTVTEEEETSGGTDAAQTEVAETPAATPEAAPAGDAPASNEANGGTTDAAMTEETPAADSPASSDVATADAASGTTAGNAADTASLASEIDISADDLIPPPPEVPDLASLLPKEPEPAAEIIEEKPAEKSRPTGCGDDPAANSPNYVAADDFSGFVISGMISDIELFVKLVEEFDRPQRQVLIEVFMINVVKDFSRKLDLSFQTDALAGNLADTDGFFLRRDLTALATNATSANPGGFVSGLISPNSQVQALVDFIETNDLGRTISSPTILVEEGGSATVTRTNSKPVTRNTITYENDDNMNSVARTTTTTVDVEASFELNVGDVAVNPNNNNVTVTFSLSDASFETTLANVTETTGQTRDNIETKFVAAPGDVIVMAGLYKQSDSVAATGLPGTTTSGLPTAFLFGGEDNVGNKIEEMIILMAPTVIEPEVGKPTPHSALPPARIVVNQ